MEIQNIVTFLAYYKRIRYRTLQVINCIPHEQLEWTVKNGRFTLGDLVRHIAAIERYMYAETVIGNPSCYEGCGTELASGFEATLNFFNRLHKESLVIFNGLCNDELMRKCKTPLGTPITTWKWLRAMVEHEIHHRGQIYLYLGILGVATPPLFGLSEGEVKAIGKQSNDADFIE